MKLIFLDIDGVLNGHEYDADAQSCTIRPPCVAEFNRVLRATGACVVLSSAWRYMIAGGAMDLTGFSYMLHTHGVRQFHLIGHTATDERVPTRGAQIMDWMERNRFEATPYVVIDDDAYDIAAHGHPLVRTDGRIGLTRADADCVIAMLGDVVPI